jgi:hypothetical protein
MGLLRYHKLATCLTCLFELIFFFLKLFLFSIHSSMFSLLVIELYFFFFFIFIFIRSSCFHSILVLLSNKIVETS